MIQKLYEGSLFFGPLEYFAESLDGWEIEDHYIGDDLAVITMRKGPEVHFFSAGLGKTLTWSRFRDFMQKVIDEEGYLCTKTPKSYVRQIRFNELVGFYKTGEDDFDFYYRIDKIRGSKPCQQ